MSIKSRLGKELLFFDGAMGSVLQEKGLLPNEIPELLNINRPDLILDIHLSYLNVGCDIIKTNTFGANSYKLKDSNYSVEDVIKSALSIAKDAVKKAGGKKRYVALDIGPTGRLLAPLGDLSFLSAVELFKEQVSLAEKYGADLILIETMNDSYETKAAVLAAKENSSLPVFVTNVYDEQKRLLTGASVLEQVLLLEGLGVDAIGANCSLGPEKMLEVFEDFKKYASIPVILSPNAGIPKEIDGKTVYDVSPKLFSETLEKIASDVHVLGGCCGTNPDYIKELILKTSNYKPCPPTKKLLSGVSSGSRSVLFKDKPILIGERINPTGKKALKEALLNENFDYVLTEAVKQQDFGADLLDVNAGVPGIDEESMLPKIVEKIQSVTALPLQIDTANAKAMENSLRIYNGKALINSVCGKKESMDLIFPIVKKYGGMIIALTLSEDGIPDNVEGRISIAKSILKEAEKYGIEKEDFIFDPLCMAISADKNAACVTLDTVSALNKMGLKTSLGISNVSFGLPARSHLNSTFFALALSRGLSCAIVNPFSKELMDCFNSSLALLGYDDNFNKFISYFDNIKEENTEKNSVSDLKSAIIKGLKKESANLAADLLENLAPMEVINNFIVPALNEVGEGFEKGTTYLPQLLISAAAAQCAFDEVRKGFSSDSLNINKTVVIATVYGDVHDIGKNIVKALLENYGFNVIDLGKNVPKEDILDAVLKYNVKLVGLSALMTVTVPEMEKAIVLLKEKSPDTRIMVGGAVLTKDYAEKIGADRYAKDAMEAVRYAEEILN